MMFSFKKSVQVIAVFAVIIIVLYLAMTYLQAYSENTLLAIIAVLLFILIIVNLGTMITAYSIEVKIIRFIARTIKKEEEESRKRS